MKKNYLLLSLLTIGMSAGFAQNIISNDVQKRFIGEEVAPRLLSDQEATFLENYKKGPKFNTKAFGDTLYYQDFANGLPAGYRVVNANQNNAVWRWDTSYIPFRGGFSATTPTITSSTAGNGFMMLPADFYNTPLPSPVIAMDTWLVSNAITIASTPGVFIRYQQFLRYCCSAANELVLELSTDSISWDAYDLTRGLTVNAANAPFAVGVSVEQFDVSASIANQTRFWYRVRSTANTHYYWMIDDIAFVEGPAHDIELSDAFMEFNWDNYGIAPLYHEVPYDLFTPLPFTSTIANNGWTTNTNVTFDVDVNLAGFGLAYSTANNIGSLAQGQDSTFVLTPNPRFVPMFAGDFQVNYLASGDSTDQVLGNETAIQSFSVYDTIFRRDDDVVGGGTGPSSYVRANSPGGTSVGDRFGVMYIVESRTGNGTTKIPTSVSFFVNTDVRNIGVEIVPKIWAFNEDSATLAGAFGAEVASSFFPYTVTASDTNTLLTIPLNTGSAVINGLDSGQYVVGWEVTTLPTGTSFIVYNDATTAQIQATVSAFVWMGHSPGWGWVAAEPVIRLNMANLPAAPLVTGIADQKVRGTIFEVMPNPNNGLFKINLASEVSTNYTLFVRNMLGQTVYNETISVNSPTTKDIDLSSLKKGVYFVSLENENSKMVKKVIVK